MSSVGEGNPVVDDNSCLEIFRLIHQRQYVELKEIAHEKFNCEMSLKDLNEQLKLGLNNSRDGESLTPLDFAVR